MPSLRRSRRLTNPILAEKAFDPESSAATTTTSSSNLPTTATSSSFSSIDKLTSTDTATFVPTIRTSVTRKRKSVAFDSANSEVTAASGAASSTPCTSRPRRRSSTTTNATEQTDTSTSTPSSSTAPNSAAAAAGTAADHPSAKALGKRRAVSPPRTQPQADSNSTSLQYPPKKRQRTEYNLRTRPDPIDKSATDTSANTMGKNSKPTSPSSSAGTHKGKGKAPAGSSHSASTRPQRKARGSHPEEDVIMKESGEEGISGGGEGNKEQPVEVADPILDTSAELDRPVISSEDDDDDDDDRFDLDDDDDEEDHSDEDDEEDDDEGNPYGHDEEHHLGEGDSQDDEEEDDDDDDGYGLPSRTAGGGVFRGGGSAAADEQLLAALESGAPGFRALHGLMSGMSTKLKGLLAQLKSRGSAQVILSALQELAELLGVATEDTLAGYFQVEPYVKEIVALLRGDASPAPGASGGGGMTAEEMVAFGMDPGDAAAGTEEDGVQIMLLACRCLANLMEALPGSAHAVVYAGAVPVLCSKLLEIQYIDLAEQTLSTLEKISEEVPSYIVREGGLGALLTYLDFFSFHVQRTAVTAAANCCRSLAPDSFTMVRDVIPILTGILSSPDQRVVEQGCLAVVRIVDSYRHYAEKLESVLTPDLLSAIRVLLNPDSSTVQPGTYAQCLKMLSTASRASPTVAVKLLELNLGTTLYHLLAGVAAPEWASDEGVQRMEDRVGADMLVMQNLVQRPKDQVQETLNLVCELLPSLPKDGIFDARAFSGKDRSHRHAVKREEMTPDLYPTPAPASTPAAVSTSGNAATPAEIEVKMESHDEAPSAADVRLTLLRGDSVGVRRFYALMLPTLVDVYSASVNTQVRSKAVLGLLKIIEFCEREELAWILKKVAMASFLAAILSSRDQTSLVTNALQLVELLLVKMPDAYQYFFRREGVMHEIERIASTPLVATPRSKKSSPTRSPTSALTAQLQQETALSPADAQAQDMVTLRARHLRDKYAAADSEPALRARTALDKITELVKQLDDNAAVVDEIAALFADDTNPLSSFELLESGLVDGLLRFATENRAEGLSLLERQEELARAFMPQLQGGAATPAFAVLVKRLQESLSRMEEFDVTLASQSSSDLDSRRHGTSMLGRQLKLRLVSEAGTDVPASCNNLIVSIHAIATFQAFHDYLRPRIVAASALAERGVGSRGAPHSGGGSLSSFLAAFAAANGSPPPDLGAFAGAASPGGSGGLGEILASASQPKEPAPPAPTRRRSSRLSGKGPDLAADDSVEAASTSKTTLDDAMPTAESDDRLMNPELERGHDEEEQGEELCPDEEDDDHDEHDDNDEEVFAEDFDPALSTRAERTVHLEVADDKLVAKTPDGTRVGTPTLGKSASTSRATDTSSATKPRGSYAAAVKSEPTDFHLEFSLAGHPVTLGTTIYGGIHKFIATTPEARRTIWHSTYTATFRKVPGPARSDTRHSSPETASRDDSMPTVLPSSISPDSQQAKILQLLWVLHTINSDYGDSADPSVAVTRPGLSEAAFVNNKLTAKLNRQLEEPMIVASACLPEWATDLPLSFPFLFPLETRYTFLQSTAFGYARLMQKWIGQSRSDNSRRDDSLGFLNRLQRQKVRISRERMLESAFKVFELYGSSKASLEVEFFAEVGSGLGPTLEFYALVSKEFARKDLSLWREGDVLDDTMAFVFNPAGLFPSPLNDGTSEAGKKRLRMFRVLGQFVAKALMDSRIIDIHFNRSFMKVILGYELPLKISSVKQIDKALGSSLADLKRFVDAKKEIEANKSLTDNARTAAIDLIKIDNSAVEDLALDFVLPGYEIDLKDNGKDVAVTIWNLEEYIALVLEWTLRKGVMLQVKEFKSGFSTVFPVRDLQSFSPSELVMMTGSVDEDWSVEGLTNAARADHGYTMDSRPVRDLISLMSELTPSERREFLSFITGAPRLPIGGFAALTPSLTIVRKDGGDGALPSVMTCVNYIKLPDYSSSDVVKDRVMTAVREGAGGFFLS